MSNLTSGFDINTMYTAATGFIAAFAPFFELVLGLLLFFMATNIIIGLFFVDKKEDYNYEEDDDDYDE